MSYFIILRGPAGVGKTTVAKKLTQLLGGYHISLDTILAKHNLDYVPGNRCVPEQNTLTVNKLIIPMAQEKLKEGTVVIFDGNFYHKSQIEDLINKLKFPHFIFTLQADVETCIARNNMRDNSLDEKEVKNVFELVSTFECGDVINSNDQTIDESILTILKKIEQP
ncbi:TPA: hypothetical protein DIC20_05435 [Candidatus Dependentiae bacterium]|nr:MAG: hypothetical protein US03_C0005G0028 [candidate division TM6 bacterium GW2011_GWF2_36_131]KKQ03133.1 MAG: hypothetical protein US13_C0005G0017 [candidate division TM6 bacterium GW2011_GWE2_36_25]KKQ19379.1 MAG: hypothetical protein US32_C0010G0028 [candidate division TM6 bacterium GW2011_GWA2_36_9]HBR71034.1 hypothetical protein [Candidatus Dependentiae bacterium]HCU01108.1 hypothetical protein [Candidatus Dependentiae bacterium]